MSKEAMKLELEALETSGDSYPALERKAIKSLRQAIATEESSATQEPVAQHNVCIECRNADSWGLPDKPVCRECVRNSKWQPLNESSVNPLYTHSQPAQPKAEQDGHDDLTIAYMSGLHRGKELAAQPKRRPSDYEWSGLSQGDFNEIYDQFAHKVSTDFIFEKMYSLIEAKLKEKNTQPAQPKREPLTDEQIEAIWVEHGLDDCDPQGFARAIEAAHGIIKTYPEKDKT